MLNSKANINEGCECNPHKLKLEQKSNWSENSFLGDGGVKKCDEN